MSQPYPSNVTLAQALMNFTKIHGWQDCSAQIILILALFTSGSSKLKRAKTTENTVYYLDG